MQQQLLSLGPLQYPRDDSLHVPRQYDTGLAARHAGFLDHFEKLRSDLAHTEDYLFAMFGSQRLDAACQHLDTLTGDLAAESLDQELSGGTGGLDSALCLHLAWAQQDP